LNQSIIESCSLNVWISKIVSNAKLAQDLPQQHQCKIELLIFPKPKPNPAGQKYQCTPMAHPAMLRTCCMEKIVNGGINGCFHLLSSTKKSN